MRPVHYISIVAAIGLVALLYWGGNTRPPKKAPGAVAAAGSEDGHNHEGGADMHMPKAASTDSLFAAARKALPEKAMLEVIALEDEITATKDSAAMAPLFARLSNVWAEHKEPRMNAYTLGQAAYLAHSEKNLNFAGQIFLDLMHSPGSPAVQVWDAQQAIFCFSQALALNPANDSTKILLATGYIEGSDDPMQGIGLLREIVAKEPDNIPANLKLGEFSIQSRQFDKAVMRMETVLKQEPNNRTALYFLAEAYKGLGQKEKAIETFEKCKKVVNNPQFSKDIDDYIKTFK